MIRTAAFLCLPGALTFAQDTRGREGDLDYPDQIRWRRKIELI